MQGLSVAGEQAGRELDDPGARPGRAGGRSSPASRWPARRPGRSWPRGVPPDRRAPGGGPAELGLAGPVLAQRRRDRRRPAHPADPAGEPGLRTETKKRQEVPKAPLPVLFREHCAGRAAGAARRTGLVDQHALLVFALSYAVNTVGLSRRHALGGRHSPTSWRWPRSRCGACSPTGSAASPCSSPVPWAGGRDLAAYLWSICHRQLRAGLRHRHPAVGLVYSAATGAGPRSTARCSRRGSG